MLQLHVQVAAYCNGRDTVTEYDCLLLEHILWQQPEHAPKIADWLLSQLAVDDGMKQVGVDNSSTCARVWQMCCGERASSIHGCCLLCC